LNKSWIDVAPDSDFPIENLPYGAFERAGATHLGVAIGNSILDLHAAAAAGLFAGVCRADVLQAPVLNPLLTESRAIWQAVRERISRLLSVDGDPALRMDPETFLVLQASSHMVMPLDIGDYVDFYSSLEHATNMGKMLRPDGEPLLPNWRWLPVGYHGRAGTIVVDGTPIARPRGQRKAPNDSAPTFGPTQSLDIELEVGFVTGSANRLGVPIPIDKVRDHLFGLVLVNDWSARDIQAWEYQPLGPFLGKSFATTISPWIVTFDALEPFRVAGPVQEPPPLGYLHSREAWSFDITLDVLVKTARMQEPQRIARSNFKNLYWNVAQQLAHATSNGAVARPGDLFASGTISGVDAESYGSLMELTWRGTKPLRLASGETRGFLQDGDEVTLHGFCEAKGARRIGFGTARGLVIA
jgi:fumarylacetoacetase